MDIEEKTFDDTVEEIIELLENRQYRSAREEILKNNGVDAAEILEEILQILRSFGLFLHTLSVERVVEELEFFSEYFHLTSFQM